MLTYKKIPFVKHYSNYVHTELTTRNCKAGILLGREQ